MSRILTASQIYDPAQGAAAYERGRQQAGNDLAGKALASGDTTAAKNALFNVGNLSAGLHLQQMQEQRAAAARARQQAEQQRAYQMLGGVVRNIKTPEQFERAKASAARTLGIDASQYTFEDLPTLQAQFADADRQLEIKERAQEAARRYLKSGSAFYDTNTGKWITPPAGAVSDEYGLNPVFGTDAAGNPILLQVGKSGRAVQTQVPEGVKVSGGVTSVPTGTGTMLVDRRTGQPIREVAKDLQGEQVQRQLGKTQGEALTSADKALTQAQTALEVIDKLRNHPGLDAAVGLTSYIPNRPGSNAYDFASLLEQAKAKNFMEARQGFKGTGTITDFESQKGEMDVGNLDVGQSKEQFLQTLDDIERGIRNSYAITKRKAAGQFGAQSSQQPMADPAQATAPAPQRAVPDPAQATPPRPAGMSNAQIIAEARKAVAAGKPAGPVRDRLKAWGINF